MINIQTKFFNPEILYIYEGYLEQHVITNEHSHDFLEISINISGRPTYHINGNLYTLKEGEVAVLNPADAHCEENTEQETCHQLHIGIENIMITGYEKNYFPTKTPVISFGKYQDDFNETVAKIIYEKNTQNTFQDLALKSLVYQLWVIILRATSERLIPIEPVNTKQKQKRELVDEIIYYLENNHAEEISLDSISSFMYVSPAYISKLFKEETGETPINYLIKIRMEKAKTLLANTDFSVKEVANKVGYQDAYHFSKLFKKYFDISPSYYARTH